MATHLFFDLDGTLTDSREGVVASIQYALRSLAAPVPDGDSLTQYVGPPLAGTFAALLDTGEPATIERAIAAYRDHFERVGMFQNRVFAGVADVLADLTRDGWRLSVVTVKPAVYARRILDHFALDRYFRSVYGPDLGARLYSKADLIGAAIVAEQVRGRDVLMVGDRAEDVTGAHEHGATAIAVSWGYGAIDELRAADPSAIVYSADELRRVLGAVGPVG